MSNTYTDPLPIPEDDSLPAMPRMGESGPQVCAAVRLYLGVLNDLPAEQGEIIREHVRTCAGCTAVERLIQDTTDIIGGLPASMPSARVDEAVREAIAARGIGRGYVASLREGDASVPTVTRATQASLPRIHTTPAPTGLSTGGFLGRIATFIGADRHIRRGGRGVEWSGDACVAHGGQERSDRETGRRRVGLRWGAMAAAAMAAVVVLSFLTMMHFSGVPGLTPQVFTLPTTLSWNGYVIYHSETRIDAHGMHYRVDTYYDPGTDRVHVETMMPGSMDVVVVGDSHSLLGMDMMHHVAQWGANEWSNDESMFNLAAIRSDMKASRATFLDKDIFRGQAVYRIRCSNGMVLLLNMQYEPVNVLRGAVGPGAGEPVYDSLDMMPSSHVAGEMWDMRVPAGFKMGALPGKP
jgi:hypothetical protein